jgi:hypothetical protein
MPFTPFHFGAGAAAHAAAPQRLSFLAFCAANVVTDCEPAWYLLHHQWPVHRFLHTFVGANVSALFTIGVFLLLQRLARRVPLPDPFDWQALRWPAVALGAFVGSYSHIVLDGLNHYDMHPFAPFTRANPMLGGMSRHRVEALCLLLGALALLILELRHRRAAARG